MKTQTSLLILILSFTTLTTEMALSCPGLLQGTWQNQTEDIYSVNSGKTITMKFSDSQLDKTVQLTDYIGAYYEAKLQYETVIDLKNSILKTDEVLAINKSIRMFDEPVPYENETTYIGRHVKSEYIFSFSSLNCNLILENTDHEKIELVKVP